MMSSGTDHQLDRGGFVWLSMEAFSTARTSSSYWYLLCFPSRTPARSPLVYYHPLCS